MRKPQEIHIENRTTYYAVIVCWGLMNVETISRKFATRKMAKDWITATYGQDHKIPVLL